jgi:hypothetical protein
MFVQGLVYEGDHLYQELPEWEEFDVPDDPDGTEEYRAWEEARAPILRAEDADPPGLPWHKIDSGVGHVLTPREIGVALEKACPVPKILLGDLAATWRDWLEFLRRAAERGNGARVDVGGEIGYLTHPPQEWRWESSNQL